MAMDLVQLDLVNAFDALNLTQAEILRCRHKRPLCWCGCVADSSQQVVYGGKRSGESKVESGVPLGLGSWTDLVPYRRK